MPRVATPETACKLALELANHLRGVAGDDHAFRDRRGHDTARADDRVSADGHALEDQCAIADEHVLGRLARSHPRGAASTAVRMQLVEVAVEDLDERTDKRTWTDANSRPLAFDVRVVVDLGAVAVLDHRRRRHDLNMAISGVEADRRPPPKLDVAADHDRSLP